MDLWSRVLKGQVPFKDTHWPSKHVFSKSPFDAACPRLPRALMLSSSCRTAQLFHTDNHQASIRYLVTTRAAALFSLRPSVYHFSCLFCAPEPQQPVCYLAKGLQARPLSSAASLVKHFAEHQVSTFREFSDGLKAFRKGNFLESSQQFDRLYKLVRQINQTTRSFELNTELLVCGCLAAALLRQGAYERAEEVSKEMVEKVMYEEQSSVDSSACFEAYRAFATMVANSAVFERKAQKQHGRIRQVYESAADHHEDGNRRTRIEKTEKFSPMEEAKLCLISVMRTYKAELLPFQGRKCPCLWELQILVESFVGAGWRPSLNLEKKRGCVPRELQGVLYDFFGLTETYNSFALQVYMFLASTAARRQGTERSQQERTRFHISTAEKLLTDAAAVLERLESQKRQGHPLHSFDSALHDASVPCQLPRDTGPDKMRREIPEVGPLCETIIENEYAAQVVLGVVQLYKGVGSCLIHLSAKENYDPQLVNFMASKDCKDGFSMGQAALKKGLTLCKQHADVDCRMVKGGLLATLASSFRCTGDAVISEGLFCSALNQFAAYTGLQTESLIEEAAETPPQSRKQAPFPAHQDQEKSVPAALDGFSLTFAERLEYASAMLQYSFLLSKWEGREFEAERLRTTAEKLSPVLSSTFLYDETRRRILECWLFSVLWRPPVTIALCLTADLSENLQREKEILKSDR